MPSPPSIKAKHSATLPEQQLDAIVKRTFSNREIISHLLHASVPEFQSVTPQYIREHCLVPDNTAGSSATSDDNHLQPLDIRLTDTIDKSPNEGDILMDLVFDVRHPQNPAEHLGLLINLEIQNKDTPGYPLLARGLYYACRLLSRQRETLFSGSDYGAIRKVYSIWICPNARPGRTNRTLLYKLDEHLLQGDPPDPPIPSEEYDRIALMLLGINNAMPVPEGKETAGLRLIEALLSDSIPTEKRQECLKKEFGMTQNTQKEAQEMKGFAGYYFEQGSRQGFEQGSRQGFEQGSRQGFEQGEKQEQLRGMQLLFNVFFTQGCSKDEAIRQVANSYQTTEGFVRQRLQESQA